MNLVKTDKEGHKAIHSKEKSFVDVAKPVRDFSKAIRELRLKRPELFDDRGYLKHPKS